MEVVQAAAVSIFSVNSIWSVVARGVLWFAVAITIIASTDSSDPVQSMKQLKSKLGYLMMFIVAGGALFFLLFSYAPTA